jgi:hypothetical protein
VDFFGMMNTRKALTCFFHSDSIKVNNPALHSHIEQKFFVSLHCWSAFLQKPSDFGLSDESYELPALRIPYHEGKTRNLIVKFDYDGQRQLIKDTALDFEDAAKEILQH